MHLRQQDVEGGRFLQPVDHQHPVEQGPGKGQGLLGGETGEVRGLGGPGLHPLALGHAGHHPPGPGAERVEEGGGIAQAQHVEARGVPPCRHQLAHDHGPHRPAERRGIEGPQFQHVPSHGLANPAPERLYGNVHPPD